MSHPSDIPRANDVEITISDAADGVRLWIHADGQMITRVYRIGHLVIDDRRTGGSDVEEKR